MLRGLKGLYAGFGVDQLHHALQTATMAKRANASDELVLVRALSRRRQGHLDPEPRGDRRRDPQALRVRATPTRCCARIRTFRAGTTTGTSASAPRCASKYRNEPWFALAEQFTDEWDQAAFDPGVPGAAARGVRAAGEAAVRSLLVRKQSEK